MTRGPRRALGLLCACAALVLLAASASVAQALPRTFWGVVPQATPTLEQLQRLKRGGVSSIRIPIVWPVIQPNRNGAMDWSGIDAQVENAASTGIEVLPFLVGAPTWAVPAVWAPGSGHSVKAPRNLPVTGAAAGGWSSFVRGAVARYRPGGSFWAEHPTLPQHPIRTWQIWNEPNFMYFVARPHHLQY